MIESANVQTTLPTCLTIFTLITETQSMVKHIQSSNAETTRGCQLIFAKSEGSCYQSCDSKILLVTVLPFWRWYYTSVAFVRYALRQDWTRKRADYRNRVRESDIRRKANDEPAGWRKIRWDITIAWLLFAREMCREVACLDVDQQMCTHIRNGATQSQSDTCKSA